MNSIMNGNKNRYLEEGPFGSSRKTQVCCLFENKVRCQRSAGNASYSRRIANTVAEKNLKLQTDPLARHCYICDHHKSVIQTARNKQKPEEVKEVKEDKEGKEKLDSDGIQVDLSTLSLNALKRYKRVFNIQTKPNCNKAQLAEAVQKHFDAMEVDEDQVITNFMYMIRSKSNRLDHPINGNSFVIDDSSDDDG